MKAGWALALMACAAGSASAQLSDWRVQRTEDRMGDGVSIGIYATASEWFTSDRRADKPSLLIACTKKRARLGIMAEVQLQPDQSAGYGRVPARIKLDDSPAVRVVGEEVNSGDAIIVPDGANWIRKLAKAKRVMVEVTPFRGAPTAIPILVSGLDVHAKEIAEYCGVKITK